MGYRIRLTFLGTSATFPTKERNHPSFLLEFEGEGILFDCGENVQRQLRTIGISPTRITKILITHWHGDHVLGLGGIFQSLNNSEYRKKLEIYGPMGIKEKIEKLLEVFDIKPSFEYEIIELDLTFNVKKFLDKKEYELYYTYGEHFIPVVEFSFKEKDKIKLEINKIKKDVGITKHKKFGLLKRGKKVEIKGKILDPNEYTYVKKGLKITYITDTIFRKNLIELSKNSNILISESMYFLNETELAKEHKHLTLNQVFEIYRKSGSDLLILTHISQRYSKEIQKFEEAIIKNDIFGIVAKDFDKIYYVKNQIILEREEKQCVLYYDEREGKIKRDLSCLKKLF